MHSAHKDSGRVISTLHCGILPVLIDCSNGRENTAGEPQVSEYNNFTLPKRQEKLQDLVTADQAAPISMGRYQGEQHDWRAVSLHIPQCHSANLHTEAETPCRDYYWPGSSALRKLLMNAACRTTIFSCTLLLPEEAGRAAPWSPGCQTAEAERCFYSPGQI